MTRMIARTRSCKDAKAAEPAEQGTRNKDQIIRNRNKNENKHNVNKQQRVTAPASPTPATQLPLWELLVGNGWSPTVQLVPNFSISFIK